MKSMTECHILEFIQNVTGGGCDIAVVMGSSVETLKVEDI